MDQPRSVRSVVVLPEPFGPRKPVIVPRCTSKLRSSTAVTAPKRFVNPRTEMAGNVCPFVGVNELLRR